ncbi:MAG: hypothetical protein KatS3mg026_1472 [Bacteroidia bacterium]|nr:MAG: hypothetical protein KatS3mg026_1472 [Bacteroidia bacterium]
MFRQVKQRVEQLLARLQRKAWTSPKEQALQEPLAPSERKTPDNVAEPQWQARVKTLNLEQHGYLISPEMAERVRLALETRPLAGAFLAGPPGSGKTYLVEVVSQALGLPLLVQQLFPGSTEETLFVRLFPDEKGDIRPVEGILVEAARLLGVLPGTQPTAAGVVLLLDEWDKSRPSADGFLLDFLQTGRIRFGNIKVQVPLERLIVFITTNEERDISEPLRRRLCRIELPPLPVEGMQQLLTQSHPNHPLLSLALYLYQVSLHPKMPRPFSVQELRQFLSATAKRDEAHLSNEHLDALIYQFLTKSREAHTLLRTLLEKEETDPSLAPATLPPYLELKRPWRQDSLRAIIEALPKLREEIAQKLREKAYGVLRLREETWQILQTLNRFEPPKSPGKFAAGWVGQTPQGPQIFLRRPLRLEDLSHFVEEEVRTVWGEIALSFAGIRPSMNKAPIRFSVAKALTEVYDLTLVHTAGEGMVFTKKGLRLWVGLPHPELLVEVPFESVMPLKLLGLLLRDASNPYWLQLAQENQWGELGTEILQFLESLPPQGANGLPWGAAFPLPKGTWGIVYLEPDTEGRLYLPKAILWDDPRLSCLGEKMNDNWGYPCELEKHRVRRVTQGRPTATRKLLLGAVEVLYKWIS